MDIQFIQFNDTLPLTSIQEIPGMSPKSLKISGPDFRTAVEVDINEQPSPSFVIASQSVIIAQVPSGLGLQPIHTVLVVSSDYTFNRQSVISFQFGREPKKISGIKVLMQMFMKIFFGSPNYDSFSKKLGGGALDVVGGNSDSPVGSSAVTAITRAVSVTSDQIRAIQARQTKLADDERLLAANLLGCSFDAASTGIDVRVELISQAGTLAVANLEV